SDIRLHPPHYAGRIHRARLPRDFLAILERDQSGNPADTVAPRDLRHRVGVELGESHPRLEPRGSLFVSWGHGPARSAPARPEIDHERQVVRLEVTVESGFSSANGCLENNACLQLPQRAPSAIRSAATRFVAWQCGHTTCMGSSMLIPLLPAYMGR